MKEEIRIFNDKNLRRLINEKLEPIRNELEEMKKRLDYIKKDLDHLYSMTGFNKS